MPQAYFNRRTLHPTRTHQIRLQDPIPDSPPILPEENKINVTPDGRILWNEAAIDLPTLENYLVQSTQRNPVPELHQPHPEARYGLVDEVLAATKRASVTMGFVGNEIYGNAF
jgi:biopolymer transport protein ExbD